MATTAAVVQLVTDSEAVIKVSGNTIAPVTINIQTDILATNQIIYPPATAPTVNIIGFQWSGDVGATYRIDRNGIRIATLLADNGNFMDFIELFPSEPTQNTQNITVTIVKNDGTTPVQGELWIRVRKVSGFASKIETAQFSVLDNLTAVGS